MNPLSLLSSAGSAISGFFGGIQGYLIGGLLIAVAAGGAGAWAGYRIEASKVAAIRLADAQSLAQAAKSADSSRARQDAVTLASALAEAKAQVQIETVTQTITKEVPKYVTVQADAITCIPVGLARILRAAAERVDPKSLSSTAGQSDDACSDVTSSEVAGWFTGYADVSNKNSEQLDALIADEKKRESVQ